MWVGEENVSGAVAKRTILDEGIKKKTIYGVRAKKYLKQIKS